jgi:hypothetical protein
VSPELAKKIVKVGASLLISVALGQTYKLGKKIDDRIDQHFTTSEPETPESEQDN